MIILELFALVVMLVLFIIGIAGLSIALDDGDKKVALAFSSLILVGLAVAYLEVSEFSIKKQENAIVSNTLNESGGFYEINYYLKGSESYRTSKRNEVELIREYKPEQLCVIHNKGLNIFGTGSWTTDDVSVVVCSEK
jgi:hypothetical protein